MRPRTGRPTGHSLLPLLMTATTAASAACPPPAAGPIPVGEQLVFQRVELVRGLDGCTPEGAGCTYIRLTYPEIESAPSSEALRRIRAFVEAAMARTVAGEPGGSSPQAVAEEFLTRYREFRQSFADAHPWMYERSLEILYHDPRVASLELIDLGYTGGAHPYRIVRYHVFDLATGRRLELRDLLREGYEEELDRLGEAAFRRVHGLAPEADLREAGFQFDGDRFAVNDNWAIEASGLLFFFNEYEIASYAAGPTAIHLERSELEPLVRRDGPLAGR